MTITSRHPVHQPEDDSDTTEAVVSLAINQASHITSVGWGTINASAALDKEGIALVNQIRRGFPHLEKNFHKSYGYTSP